MSKGRFEDSKEIPENLPKYCGRCGGRFTEPRPVLWQGIPLEPVSGLSPRDYPRKEGELDELIFQLHLYCKNKRCRRYQAFNLGGRFLDEGHLNPEEHGICLNLGLGKN